MGMTLETLQDFFSQFESTTDFKIGDVAFVISGNSDDPESLWWFTGRVYGEYEWGDLESRYKINIVFEDEDGNIRVDPNESFPFVSQDICWNVTDLARQQLLTSEIAVFISQHLTRLDSQ